MPRLPRTTPEDPRAETKIPLTTRPAPPTLFIPLGFQSSSMVEQSAVNRRVAGSSPASGAKSHPANPSAAHFAQNPDQQPLRGCVPSPDSSRTHTRPHTPAGSSPPAAYPAGLTPHPPRWRSKPTEFSPRLSPPPLLAPLDATACIPNPHPPEPSDLPAPTLREPDFTGKPRRRSWKPGNHAAYAPTHHKHAQAEEEKPQTTQYLRRQHPAPACAEHADRQNGAAPHAGEALRAALTNYATKEAA